MKLEFKWCNLTVVAYLVTSTFFCQAAHSQANSQESRTPVATQPAPVPAARFAGGLAQVHGAEAST